MSWKTEKRKTMKAKTKDDEQVETEALDEQSVKSDRQMPWI